MFLGVAVVLFMNFSLILHRKKSGKTFPDTDKEMEIIRKVSDLSRFVEESKSRGRHIGLVPTMGALHAGHISLVRRAVSENDVCVVSVFVNPTQFNNPADLASYPRDEEADFALLREAGVTAVFAPSVEEVYPDGAHPEKEFDLGTAAEVMEGRFRPGHFQGVAQIVSKLLLAVRPDRAYFGEKDFQQIAVIRNMVRSEGIGVEIVACPICRADDGLALSSRNALLTPQQRAVAPGIHAALADSLSYARDHSPASTLEYVTERVNALPECSVEYYEIVAADTLLPAEDWNSPEGTVGCITVYCGNVRLIDNIRYN